MEKSIVQKIVKASGIKENELVLVQFWGEDKDIHTMHSFAEAVASLGASPIELQQSRTHNAGVFAVANESSFSEKYFSLLSNFDAVLDLFSYRPVVLGTTLDAAQTGLYRKYISSLFGSLMKTPRFMQIRIPTQENAMETQLPPEEYIQRMMSAYDIDYEQIGMAGKKRISELKKNDSLVLSTGKGCKLNFNLSGREWHLDAGDGDLPCGEVYIAPLETETNGSVYFDRLYVDEWGECQNVTLFVEKGIVISSDDINLNIHFAELDEADKTVCELGFGLNPNINELCGYTVLDEKACDTFHIAIGTNTMFGGRNESQHHIDFVGAKPKIN